MRLIIALILLPSFALSANDDIRASLPLLSMERSQARLIVRGNVSSAGHEQVLRRSAALGFSENELEFDVSIRTGLPVAWSLITDLTLRALTHTSSATAEITPQRIVIRGFTSDLVTWGSALGRLKMILPAEIILDSSVATLTSLKSFESTCRQLFVTAFRLHIIEFTRGNEVLSSSAHGLLDELTELGADCPAALVRITGNGDGGTNNQETGLLRAEAVRSYLAGRGFNAARLSVFGAEVSTNRRIVFSVGF